MRALLGPRECKTSAPGAGLSIAQPLPLLLTALGEPRRAFSTAEVPRQLLAPCWAPARRWQSLPAPRQCSRADCSSLARSQPSGARAAAAASQRLSSTMGAAACTVPVKFAQVSSMAEGCR